MVLQMLLENAVKHGLDNIREGGEISVDTELKDEVLYLTVSNSLPTEDESKQRQSSHGESGIGLINIEQRLDLLYGDRGSIETHIKDDCFIVNVQIPQS